MDLKRLPARFYESASGREPVRDWLRELEPRARRVVGLDIKRVEFGWPIGMPLCRSLGRGLWEVRSDLPDGRVARVIFAERGGAMVLLHGFIKKTQQTPPGEIEIAMRRWRDTTP
ncbi:MAG: type II toxin-antitoxin system RelE/ParE family toxin [Geminicoccaceae bacterium]